MQVVIKVSALRKSERHKQYEILRFYLLRNLLYEKW